MIINRKRMLTVLVASAVSAMFATQSFAKISPERRAAIIKCSKAAAKAFPVNDEEAGDHGRYDAYEACMAQAGQEP